LADWYFFTLKTSALIIVPVNERPVPNEAPAELIWVSFNRIGRASLSAKQR